MALVPAKCTQCGGNIEVDDTHEAGICKFCGTSFVTEKVINNYNVTNNINANVVNFYGGSKNDFEIRAGVLERYNGAATDVIIPNSVTIIGKEAFMGCTGLKSIIIPDIVTSIEEGAFKQCEGLTNVRIPNSVTNIGDFAFCQCKNINEVILSKSINTINVSTFHACHKLKKVVIPENVTSIKTSAFCGCGIESINLPEGLRSIGETAFLGCNHLASVDIPNSVSSIGKGAFSSCKKLADVVIRNDDTIIGEDAFLFTPSYSKIHDERESSSQDISTKKNGCYIATCVYGSYDCPQVWTLRRYRDYTLDETWYGRLFIKCYYAVSPKLVKWFGNYAWFRKPWKKFLDSMVERLNSEGVADTKYSDKY